MIGWLGSLMFALSGAPQAYKSYKDGHGFSLSLGTLMLWTGGEIFTLYAVTNDHPVDYLIFNYLCNSVFLIVMWRYRLYPRRQSKCKEMHQ